MNSKTEIELTLRAAMTAKSILALVGVTHIISAKIIIQEAAKHFCELDDFIDKEVAKEKSNES